jgi:hypothetical protein
LLVRVQPGEHPQEAPELRKRPFGGFLSSDAATMHRSAQWPAPAFLAAALG